MHAFDFKKKKKRMPPAKDTRAVRLTITETDEINTPFATYVYSETNTAVSKKGRVDILVSLCCCRLRVFLLMVQLAQVIGVIVVVVV
jgi:hypothetical protein